MMNLWISSLFIGTLCAAQSNFFSNSGNSPFSNGGLSSAGGQFNQLPSGSSAGASSGSLAGASAGSSAGASAGSSAGASAGSSAGSFAGSSAGASASSSASASASASTQIVTPQPYPACLAANPNDAFTSPSRYAYALLEGSFTNPFLRAFYNTTFSTGSFFNAIYDEVSETLSNDKSRILAGSLALLFENVYPRITPLLNAVSITNAFNEILSEEGIIITDDKEEYVEPFLTSLSKAVSASDGSAVSQAQSVVSGLLNYMDQVNLLTYSKFNEFISILAGEYNLAIYSTCKPSTYDSIPKP